MPRRHFSDALLLHRLLATSLALSSCTTGFSPSVDVSRLMLLLGVRVCVCVCVCE
jgi:hypothetical protein